MVLLQKEHIRKELVFFIISWSPSTEITEVMANYKEVNVEWASNEKVAAEVSIGVSMVGTYAVSCMKHVGMNDIAAPLFLYIIFV